MRLSNTYRIFVIKVFKRLDLKKRTRKSYKKLIILLTVRLSVRPQYVQRDNGSQINILHVLSHASVWFPGSNTVNAVERILTPRIISIHYRKIMRRHLSFMQTYKFC